MARLPGMLSSQPKNLLMLLSKYAFMPNIFLQRGAPPGSARLAPDFPACFRMRPNTKKSNRLYCTMR